MASQAFNTAGKKAVIYSPSYDILVEGVDKLHPVDTRKSTNVFNELVRRGFGSIQYSTA